MDEDLRKWAQAFVLVSTAFVSAYAMVAPPTWKPYMDAYITAIMSAAAALHILPARSDAPDDPLAVPRKVDFGNPKP